MEKEKYILAIEASARNCSVAISANSQVIVSIYEPSMSMQAERLIPMTEKALQDSGLSFEDINYLTTTRGPGSFTGIRIALSAATGFLIANPHIIPIVLNNFTFYHWRAKRQVMFFDYSVVLVDAYRGGCYMAIFDSSGNLERPWGFYFQEELIKFLNNFHRDKKLICSGNYLAHIHNLIDNPAIIILPRFSSPQAKTLCKIAYENICIGNIDDNLEPLYIAQAITN